MADGLGLHAPFMLTLKGFFAFFVFSTTNKCYAGKYKSDGNIALERARLRGSRGLGSARH